MILSHTPTKREIVSFVVFGDGRYDFRVLKAICEKFNGAKELVSPQLQGAKGLTNSLRSVAKLLDILRINVEKTKFVILIDKEHIGDIKQMKKKITEFFISESIKEDVQKQFFKFKILRGSKKTTLYIIVMGYNKCIEENISHLIEKIYGERVAPTRQSIREFLRRKGINFEDLIRRASQKALNEAFGNVVELLKEIDR